MKCTGAFHSPSPTMLAQTFVAQPLRVAAAKRTVREALARRETAPNAPGRPRAPPCRWLLARRCSCPLVRHGGGCAAAPRSRAGSLCLTPSARPAFKQASLGVASFSAALVASPAFALVRHRPAAGATPRPARLARPAPAGRRLAATRATPAGCAAYAAGRPPASAERAPVPAPGRAVRARAAQPSPAALRCRCFQAHPPAAQVDDRLNGDGAGIALGVNDPVRVPPLLRCPRLPLWLCSAAARSRLERRRRAAPTRRPRAGRGGGAQLPYPSLSWQAPGSPALTRAPGAGRAPAGRVHRHLGALLRRQLQRLLPAVRRQGRRLGSVPLDARRCRRAADETRVTRTPKQVCAAICC